MKCEIVRDLLPLYIDGITSEVSSKEIEAHMETCSECRQCCQAMKGRLPEMLPKAEVDSIEIIKKAGKKRKRMKRLVISAMTMAGALCLILGIIVLATMPGRVKYEDVVLEYGVVNSNEAYVAIRPKAGKIFELSFSGDTHALYDEQGQETGSVSTLTIWGSRGIDRLGQCRLAANCGGGSIAEWTLIFSDKVVVIRNGELISIDDVEE